MGYVNKLAAHPQGLNEQQVKAMVAELDRLLKIYPDVKIKEIIDLHTLRRENYSREGYIEIFKNLGFDDEKIDKVLSDMKIREYEVDDPEFHKKDYEGKYEASDGNILINHVRVKSSSLLSECIEKRKELRQRLEKRRAMGIDVGKIGDRIWNECRCVEGLVRHEFGHALQCQYDIDENEEMIKLYEVLDKDSVSEELGDYANKNIGEFIAVAFEESFLDDCSDIAKQVRKLIDKCVKNGKAMSEVEKKIAKVEKAKEEFLGDKGTATSKKGSKQRSNKG